MKTLFALLTLLLSLACAAFAEYSPDVLFVKMRSPVRASVLDGQLSTSSNTVNKVIVSAARNRRSAAGSILRVVTAA